MVHNGGNFKNECIPPTQFLIYSKVSQSETKMSTKMDNTMDSTMEHDDDDDDVTYSLQMGDVAPNFTCETHLGMLSYHDVIDGKFAVLVTFPQNFDAVATTELGMMAKLKQEFDARNVSLYALSQNSKASHRQWVEEVQELQDCQISFPLLCDVDGSISKLYGISKGSSSSSSLIVITDIDKRIRYTSMYPNTTGRNFYEIIRFIDSLQLTLFHKVSTPANWMQGEDVFVRNDIATDTAKSIFAKGVVVLKNWFRITPQPNSE